MFRTADGTNLAVAFILITSLFLLWGFCNGMIDILNKQPAATTAGTAAG
jgi:FHS family L-fucose permease-like MFS transporter